MTVYRISRVVYPAHDGRGAMIYGGRWNPKGYPVVYACESRSLCALEVLVNSSGLPAGMAVIEITIPETIAILRVEDLGTLPLGWDQPAPDDSTRNIGKQWLEGAFTAVLSVPSSVIPEERNYLLNPQHPAFGGIRFGPPVPFHFDARLK